MYLVAEATGEHLLFGVEEIDVVGEEAAHVSLVLYDLVR
jgi:hypothetical protein